MLRSMRTSFVVWLVESGRGRIRNGVDINLGRRMVDATCTFCTLCVWMAFVLICAAYVEAGQDWALKLGTEIGLSANV